MKTSKADKQEAPLPLLTQQQINMALAKADTAFEACSIKTDNNKTIKEK